MRTFKNGTRASDGAIELELCAMEKVVEVEGRELRLLTYDGVLPGPTITAFEGDRLRVRFHNALLEPTNLHFHGMHMPVEVDDPHRVVQPGETVVYEFTVPEGAAGTYWYHPHVHGEVAWQLGAGLAGAMVVRGPDDLRDPLLGAEERVLVLQDLSLEAGAPRRRTPMELHDGREGELVLVNGEVTPRTIVDAGLVRIRLVNASSARFYDVVIDGAEMYLLGLDAGLLEAPVLIDHVLLPPGQRADVLVRATEPGTFSLAHRPYDRGVFRLPWTGPRALPNDGLLTTIEVRGHRALVNLPESLRPVEQLDPRQAVTTRIFEYGGQGNPLKLVFELMRGRTYGPGEGSKSPVRFWLNGREFAPGRVDVEAVLGTMEIWEIRNPTPLDHPFHLHIHPFQVLDIDDVAPGFRAWQDVVRVPAGSTVRILVPFRDFAGLTMFHCHILEHEDNGMMGHLLVVDPTESREARALHAEAHSC